MVSITKWSGNHIDPPLIEIDPTECPNCQAYIELDDLEDNMDPGDEDPNR